MPRPRKDGKASVQPVRIGKKRPTGNGNRTWQVRAYAPTPGAPHGRVVYRRPGTSSQTSSVPVEGQTLDELFDQVERALDQGVALGNAVVAAGLPEARPGRRDIRALAALYLDYLEHTKKRDPDYVANRRSQLNKWVLPLIGDVLVQDWGPDDSHKVINKVREAGKSGARVEDIGVLLSGLRATARRKRAGGRWLSPDEDPLEGVEYSRGATVQGASRNFVPKQKRPATEMVDKAIAAAAELGRWTWMAVIISLAGYCAPRQAEQLGMRAIDVDLRAKELDINGVWKVAPSGQRAGRGKVRKGQRRSHPKNKLRRTAPYRGSQHEDLRRLCAAALGLPPDATSEVVTEAIEAERERRSELTTSGDWRDAVVPANEEPWLFPGEDGLPPTREQFNDAWHVIRDAIGWKKFIPYRNLRHHSALWWRAQGFDWAEIASWDGHDVRTLQAYYWVPSEDSMPKAREVLDGL